MAIPSSDRRERFLAWLGVSPDMLSPAELEAKIADWQRAEAEQREERRGTLEAACLGYAAPPLTDEERPAFHAWLIGWRVSDGKWDFETDDDSLYVNEAVDRWRHERERAAADKAATLAERARAEAEQRAERERQAAAREAERERKRAAFLARLQDDAWAKGEDPASLRDVCAWRRENGVLVQLSVTEGATRDALRVANDALETEVQAREAEIAAAETANRDVVRRARGEPNAPVPLPIDLCADPDAIARWLVAHLSGYELTVGVWKTVERTRTISGKEWDGSDDRAETYQARELRVPENWDKVLDAAERWAAFARAEAEAKTHPGDADTLRAAGVDAVMGEGAAWLVAEERGRWNFAPPDEDKGPRIKTPKRAAARVGEVMLGDAAVIAYRKFRGKTIRPSTKQVVKAMRAAGAKGQDAALRDAYRKVEEDPDAHGA